MQVFMINKEKLELKYLVHHFIYLFTESKNKFVSFLQHKANVVSLCCNETLLFLSFLQG